MNAADDRRDGYSLAGDVFWGILCILTGGALLFVVLYFGLAPR